MHISPRNDLNNARVGARVAGAGAHVGWFGSESATEHFKRTDAAIKSTDLEFAKWQQDTMAKIDQRRKDGSFSSDGCSPTSSPSNCMTAAENRADKYYYTTWSPFYARFQKYAVELRIGWVGNDTTEAELSKYDSELESHRKTFSSYTGVQLVSKTPPEFDSPKSGGGFFDSLGTLGWIIAIGGIGLFALAYVVPIFFGGVTRTRDSYRALKS